MLGYVKAGRDSQASVVKVKTGESRLSPFRIC